MKTFTIVAALCLALAISVNGQRCPINSQDVNSLDLKPVKPACAGLGNPPKGDVCDSCFAAFFTAFSPTFPKFGLTAETIPSDPNQINQAILNSITPCTNVLLPALNKAGVNVAQLAPLRNCPQQFGPKITTAAQAVFPTLPPVAEPSKYQISEEFTGKQE